MQILSIPVKIMYTDTHVEPSGDGDFNNLVTRNTVHGPTRQEVLSGLSSTQNLKQYRNGRRSECRSVDLEEAGCDVLSLYNQNISRTDRE